MKRGFLNTPKARSQKSISETRTAPSPSPSPRSPRPSGHSKKATKLDLHKPPPDIQAELDAANDDRKRIVFRSWPRDSKGQHFPDSNNPDSRGKETSNGIKYWGATLYDFYHVFRMPKNMYYRSIETGSRLAKAMRKFGELVAEDEILRADMEEKPRQLQPYDVEKLIEEQDKATHTGRFDDKSMRKGKTPENASGAAQESPESISSSLFDISSYPYPWPFIPFDLPDDPPKLQKRLPLHVLPNKLIVHDPWNVLSIRAVHEDHDIPWTQKNDIVRTYSLQLSEHGQQTVADELEARKEAIAVAEKKAREGPDLLYIPGGDGHGPIACVVPPRDPIPDIVPEAHLYLSAKHILGKGHHSFVYKAELELPRSLLVEHKRCEECIFDGMDELADEAIARASHPNQVETGKGNISSDNASPSEQVDLSRYTLGGGVSRFDAGNMPPLGTQKGPVTVAAHPKIRWQHPQYAPGLCEHNLPPGKGVPRTAKVQVAAKLSVQHDHHLVRESGNYQQFPAHFFEHWNGYNLIKPLRDPVPVGAVVPQFYGYYVPDPPEQGNEEGSTDPLPTKEDHSPAERFRSGSPETSESYLSPIMLLEECGTPIMPEKLTKDQKKECVSLLYKFHRAGWLHDSFAIRNFVVQPGPLTESPTFRMSSGVSSFRLIDFGRSAYTAKPDDTRERGFDNAMISEERGAAETLQVDQLDAEFSYCASTDSIIDEEESSDDSTSTGE